MYNDASDSWFKPKDVITARSNSMVGFIFSSQLFHILDFHLMRHLRPLNDDFVAPWNGSICPYLCYFNVAGVLGEEPSGRTGTYFPRVFRH